MPLFDRPRPSVKLADPGVHPGDERRLKVQHHAIAERLREGPATNLELGMISQRFSARLHELTKAGFLWKWTRLGPGVNRYEMVRDFLPESR